MYIFCCWIEYTARRSSETGSTIQPNGQVFIPIRINLQHLQVSGMVIGHV